MRRRVMVAGAAMAVTALIASACGSSSTAGSFKGNSTITIGYISSATGVASSTYADGSAGAAARIALQNAEGGVDGHKLVLVAKDDQSNPNENLTAAESLVGAGAFGVINYSPFAFTSARYLNQRGIPVTGTEFDGPEWGQEPYTNMFSWAAPLDTPFDGKYYAYTGDAQYLKSVGVSKLASLTYQVPSAVRAVKDLVDPGEAVGISDCYDNLNEIFGSVDFTSDVLAIKQKGCNAVDAPLVDSSDIALSEQLKQAGLNVTQLYYTGYSQDLINDPAANAAFQNAYVDTTVNFTTPNAATQAMLAAIVKYDPTYKGGIPDIGLYGSYIAADLMIDGLKLAGQDPSRTAFIANLRKVTGYTAEGIFASPEGFTNFGTAAMLAPRSCGWMVQLKGKQFVVANQGQPICGNLVPAN